MSAEPAYAYRPARAPERAPRPAISVVRGRQRAASAGASPSLVLAVKIAAVVLVALTCMAFARVALSAATVATSMESQELSSRIDEARSTGTSLEVSESVLANPTRVRQEAERLGMAAPAEVGTIALEPDVVVTDENGALSLSGSIDAAAQAGE